MLLWASGGQDQRFLSPHSLHSIVSGSFPSLFWFFLDWRGVQSWAEVKHRDSEICSLEEATDFLVTHGSYQMLAHDIGLLSLVNLDSGSVVWYLGCHYQIGEEFPPKLAKTNVISIQGLADSGGAFLNSCILSKLWRYWLWWRFPLILCWCKLLPEVYRNKFLFLQNEAFIYLKILFPWRGPYHMLGKGNLLIPVIGSRNLLDTWLLLSIMPVLLRTGASSKGFCRTCVLRNRLQDSLFFMLFFVNMSDWLCGSDCQERWFISYEPLNPTHLETTLIATDLKLSHWPRMKCSGSPSHPRTLAFLSLCNVKLCTGVSTFTNNNICTPNVNENRPAESVNVCV